MLWSYEIIPLGKEQPVERGNLDAPTLEVAQKLATTGALLDAPLQYEHFEVRIFDGARKEVWRGPYLGLF
jgi:hypothetical protein